MRLDTNGKCMHDDWRILIAKEDKHGVITPPHNYTQTPTENKKQEITRWCADCGALEIDKVWELPHLSTPTKPHKCPVCDGTGLTNKPPGVAGDQKHWVSDSTQHTCKHCEGNGIVWEAE